MKQEMSKTVPPILAVCQSLSSVHFRMSNRLFHESGIPKDYLTFRQVQQSFLCGSFMSSSSRSPGKNIFLPKWLTNSIRSLFNVHFPLSSWSSLVLPAADVSHCHEKFSILKHLNAIFCSLWKVWKMPIHLKYISVHLENLTNMTTSLTIISDYL